MSRQETFLDEIGCYRRIEMSRIERTKKEFALPKNVLNVLQTFRWNKSIRDRILALQLWYFTRFVSVKGFCYLLGNWMGSMINLIFLINRTKPNELYTGLDFFKRSMTVYRLQYRTEEMNKIMSGSNTWMWTEQVWEPIAVFGFECSAPIGGQEEGKLYIRWSRFISFIGLMYYRRFAVHL